MNSIQAECYNIWWTLDVLEAEVKETGGIMGYKNYFIALLYFQIEQALEAQNFSRNLACIMEDVNKNVKAK